MRSSLIDFQFLTDENSSGVRSGPFVSGTALMFLTMLTVLLAVATGEMQVEKPGRGSSFKHSFEF